MKEMTIWKEVCGRCKKIYMILCLVFLSLIVIGNVSGCGVSKEKRQADVSNKLGAGPIENETEFSGDIFYWGAEEYFYMLEGEWIVKEYVGSISDYHFDEAKEEGYLEEGQEYASEATEKYLGSEYCVNINNLVYFGPYTDLDFVMENNDDLFFLTRFIPGEFITINPPYIGVSVQLTDKDESYRFLIDKDGTVLIEIDYCFFKLERK